MRHGRVGRRVDQQLRRDSPSVTCALQCDHRGEVAAGAVATYANAVRISAKRCRVGLRPAHCGIGVLHRCGERVLRGQPVRHAEHVHVAVVRQHATGLVVRVEITEHEAAAMEEHEQRLSRGVGDVGDVGAVAAAVLPAAACGRCVMPGVQRAGVAVQRQVTHAADRCGLRAAAAGDGRDVAPVAQARIAHRGAAHRHLRLAPPRGEDELHMRIEREPVDHARAFTHHAQQP